MHKVLGVLMLMFLIGCGTSNEDVTMNPINNKWNKKTAQKFKLEITDPENLKNIIFVVRNNNEYPYSNIRFIVNFKNPKSKIAVVDTLNYILAKPNGEWLGTGFGETKETLFQYRTNYKFPEKGIYEINIQQAMRNDNLPGIEDLGIKVETAKP
ncbi:gliding motility lipoprotein GldH [Chryseobacterium wangxinyae]|uniref:gliding motility lipoprotein GldH n=1 Tax=Chryseobacterium sp. CY350 TaxID=2997336 RepID=UPI00226F53E6|nr:gliding motility lipoprotein GldH [Chryseobacterium sp. CY350]MCY0975958.1 gliding motility lipoprotein GldH [Chryseobacterium sp. CY350]WBZ94438.1 gliding motility lipoprotein GldH [Chryseobacterium sp. CY350]